MYVNVCKCMYIYFMYVLYITLTMGLCRDFLSLVSCSFVAWTIAWLYHIRRQCRGTRHLSNLSTLPFQKSSPYIIHNGFGLACSVEREQLAKLEWGGIISTYVMIAGNFNLTRWCRAHRHFRDENESKKST